MKNLFNLRFVGGGGDSEKLGILNPLYLWERVSRVRVADDYKMLPVLGHFGTKSQISAKTVKQVQHDSKHPPLTPLPSSREGKCAVAFTLAEVFSPHPKRVHSFGFTLAEVLITLGIIGVVTAITIPSLVNKIQDAQHIAKWKREYSLIENAFKATLTENKFDVCENYNYYGTSTLFSYDFMESMMSKFKVIDHCVEEGKHQVSERCYRKKWAGIYVNHSKYKAFGCSANRYCGGVNSYNFKDYAYLLNDGATVYFGSGLSGPWIVVDVNNFTKGPNEFGRDVFVIRGFSNVRTEKHFLKPMGAEGTFDKTKNGEVCKCSKSEGNKSANYIIQAGNEDGRAGVVLSGACCSAYYLTR